MELYVGGGYSSGKLYGFTYDEENVSTSDVSKNKTEDLYVVTIVMGGTLGASYDAEIAGADIVLFARYDLTAYAQVSDFIQDHGNVNFYSNDGDIYNRLSLGLSVLF
jgi:gamma-glutamylcysteine synthetase